MRIPIGLIRLGLAVLGIIGVPVTGYLAAKGHEKALKTEDPKEKRKCYLPAILSGTATVGCIAGSYRAGTKEIAIATATAAFAVKNRDQIEAEAKALMGETEGSKLVQAAREETVKKLPNGPSVEWTGHGTMKFIETYSGRQFYSSLDKVYEAEQRLNRELAGGLCVCLNDFYRLLGISESEFGRMMGWPNDPKLYYGIDQEVPIDFIHTMVNDENGNPVCLIEVLTYPMEEWRDI